MMRTSPTKLIRGLTQEQGPNGDPDNDGLTTRLRKNLEQTLNEATPTMTDSMTDGNLSTHDGANPWWRCDIV